MPDGAGGRQSRGPAVADGLICTLLRLGGTSEKATSVDKEERGGREAGCAIVHETAAVVSSVVFRKVLDLVYHAIITVNIG